ncbi:MAG: SIS domain-containing protein [Bdellovibrionaceae bacterium]|nr:SIS domain-containing protein [Bdellovibrionales bacterium]MCB9254429.1 SIS domain-containing protein [Pseudobdellovibrionaceae bacterium]
MKHYIETLRRNIEDSIEAHQRLLAAEGMQEVFAQAVKLVVDAYKKGGRLYIAGNGGSAADAQHLAAEFVSKLARPRAPLPAEALTVDTSILTAIGNDYGYDQVFSRQIRGKMTPRDVFLGITTSGQSINILKALETCKDMEIPSIVFCGRDGGPAKPLADLCVVAPGSATSRIQENHIVLYHTLCECVESELFPEENA